MRALSRVVGAVGVAGLIGLGLVAVPVGAAPIGVPAQPAQPGPGVTVTQAVHHDTSPSLSSILPAAPPDAAATHRQFDRVRPSVPPNKSNPAPGGSAAPPIAPQNQAAPAVNAPTVGQNFAGMNYSNSGGDWPSDSNGDVGPNNYVQIVNTALAVYSKTGAVQHGPAQIYTLWAGFGEPGQPCQSSTDGDPIVNYDELANRWVISQQAQFPSPVPSTGPAYFQCIAVSTTGDPLGTYNRYAFSYDATHNPDYPKVSVWPDGYYVTYNLTDPSVPDGFVETCAFDRSKMLAGLDATQQCVDLEDKSFSFVPSDLDGATPPPVGSPNFILGQDPNNANQLIMYRFHVDWVTPTNSTLSTPLPIVTAAFSDACTGVIGEDCIPQPGGANPPDPNNIPADFVPLLDSLPNAVMYRLAYRNYGTHESLAANLTVTQSGAQDDGPTAPMWFEIRSPNATPTIFDQGNFQPDADYRWMGSIAMDKNQNMALGYSKSSATTSPSIAYTGRLANDVAGSMQAEVTVDPGGDTYSPQEGVQNWGDYTSMQVDPIDDCTFWYTNQYVPRPVPSSPWNTRIVSFKFPSCSGSVAVPGAPTGVTAAPGDGQATAAWVAPASNGGLPVTGYTATASPAGVSCSTIAGVTSDPQTCVLAGLPNGIQQTVTVVATNAIGNSAASIPPAPVTPLPPPTPPTPSTPAVATSASPGANDECVKAPNRSTLPLGRAVPLLAPDCTEAAADQPIAVDDSLLRATVRGDARFYILRCQKNNGKTSKPTRTGYGKWCSKKQGKLVIKTFSHGHKLRLTWYAPPAGIYSAYRLIRTYRT